MKICICGFQMIDTVWLKNRVQDMSGEFIGAFPVFFKYEDPLFDDENFSPTPHAYTYYK